MYAAQHPKTELIFFCIGIHIDSEHLDALPLLLNNNSVMIQNAAIIIVSHGQKGAHEQCKNYLTASGLNNIHWLDENTKIAPGFIYVVPEEKVPVINHHEVCLLNEFLHPITFQSTNSLLQSIARSFGNKSIAIILSDSFDPFSSAVKAIKEEGGNCFFKYSTHHSSHFQKIRLHPDTQPDIFSNLTDIHSAVNSIINENYTPRADSNSTFSNLSSWQLSQILRTVLKVTGFDFQQYKTNTLIRRIGKRLNSLNINNPDNYLKLLEENPAEASILKDEFLIGVTQFNRDPEMFQIVYNQLLPFLLNIKRQNQINIWSVGCASGEEAYTLAMLFAEYISVHNLNCSFNIIATDIDEQALEKARKGIYSSEISKDLPAYYLNKYFTQDKHGYKIKSFIRETVNFRQHNLVMDAPLYNMDLICCRNLLIYLKPHIQKRIISLFRASLNFKGALILGNSESLGDMQSFFEPIDNPWRIYIHKNNHQNDE